jgi:uncharacterized protein YlxW (UPF0749 family)
MSLHEELLAAFLASAESAREVAAVNEIKDLRKRVRQLEAQVEKLERKLDGGKK